MFRHCQFGHSPLTWLVVLTTAKTLPCCTLIRQLFYSSATQNVARFSCEQLRDAERHVGDWLHSVRAVRARSTVQRFHAQRAYHEYSARKIRATFEVSSRSSFIISYRSWATVCKTVRPVQSDRCSICPVCDVGVFCPNGSSMI